MKNFKTSVGLFCATVTYLLCTNINARAAETVVLRYGILADSISVAELKNIAQTGKVDGHYKNYTDQLPVEKRKELLEILRKKYPVNFVTLSRFLYTPVGVTLLEDLSNLTSRSDNGGMQALRRALVQGSSTSEGLSILSFIDAYPSDNIVIDVEQASKVFPKLNLAYKQTQQFMEAITPKPSNTQGSQFNLPSIPTQRGGAVEVLNLSLKDEKRLDRSVPVDIYFTNTTVAKPVIVLSHGFSSDRTDMRYIAFHLASHGYIVAAVEHTGSNQAYEVSLTKRGIIPLIQPQEFLDRPQDISFVLNKLAELNKTAKHLLQNKMITDNVTVIGHSFGGATALTIAGGELQLDYLKEYCRKLKITTNSAEALQCFAQGLPKNRYQLRDSRIKQVIALNPTTSLMFGKTGLKNIQVPVLILASSADQIAPALTEQIIGFNKIRSPKLLVGIVGATHGSVKDPGSTANREEKPGSIEVVGEKAADIRKYIKTITLAFVSQNASSARDYQVFLTPEYAQSVSTKSFPIRIVTEIPADTMASINEIVKDK
jgi:predicted dienelactone hydrolase